VAVSRLKEIGEQASKEEKSSLARKPTLDQPQYWPRPRWW
jgi:hypothetical protein